MEKYEIDQVLFKQWISIDWSTLETHCLPSEKFADLFCEKLEILRPGKICVALCRDVFFGKAIMAASTLAGRCGKGRIIQKLDSKIMQELKSLV